MRLSLRESVLILTCASLVAVETKEQETPSKTQEAPKTQEAAKTQETAPTPPASQTSAMKTGAASVTTTDGATVTTTVGESKGPVAGHPVALPKDVKNLYIEPMVDELDLYLRTEFSKQLPRRIVIVSKPEDADAVMTGIGEWHSGTVQEVTGRVRGENDSPRGSVQVLSKGLLWTSQAWGLLKSGSQRKIADRIVHNFKNVLGRGSEKDMSESYY